MTWTAASQSTTRAVRIAAAIAAALVPHAARGQTPAPAPAPTPTPAPYRAPTIVLAEPEPAGSVPADRPIVVFRFTAGEPTDPMDVSSFRVWVDGAEQSKLFQIGDAEAWGPLAPMASPSPSSARDSLGRGAPVIRPGVHLVSARLCSTRGICGAVHAPVTVSPGAESVAAGGAGTRGARPPTSQVSSDTTAEKSDTKRKVWNAVLAGLRKLIAP